jgi:hypothetical protein
MSRWAMYACATVGHLALTLGSLAVAQFFFGNVFDGFVPWLILGYPALILGALLQYPVVEPLGKLLGYFAPYGPEHFGYVWFVLNSMLWGLAIIKLIDLHKRAKKGANIPF